MAGSLRKFGGKTKEVISRPSVAGGFLTTYFVMVFVYSIVDTVPRFTVGAVCVSGAAVTVAWALTRSHTTRLVESMATIVHDLQENTNSVIEESLKNKREYEKSKATIIELARDRDRCHRQYNELLTAKTEDVIALIHLRLSEGDPPTEYVMSDVPKAPQAPPGVQAPF